MINNIKLYPIKGYEGIYSITKSGQVWSHVREDRFRRPVGGYWLTVLKRRYCNYTLAKNGNNKQFCLHRLLAKAFIPNPENKPEINHKNGIKMDNRLSNLEWVTVSENRIHAFKNGLQVPTKRQAEAARQSCYRLHYKRWGINKDKIIGRAK